ncbi:DUF916 and DUF3324 domain-containing protein [Candidatus Enterococcus murrayae]|uniref:DUF916 and DUF3324 domain-containing protein n=1 Tax=Enterococcus TaxID=1350 RepID=UPI003242B573
MRREKRQIIIPCLSLFLLFLFPTISHADDTSTESKMGFSIESVIPENQLDKTKSYYYLSMQPGQKQTIQVKVKSLQKDPVTVTVAVHDAVSSSVGAIDYAKENPKLDKSLKNPITSLVKPQDGVKEVTVKDKEEKLVSFDITMPEKAFEGVKLGSLRFVKRDKVAEKQKTGLVPKYARVVALMLTEDDETFNHGADIKLKDVGLQLSNGRKVIAARIQNNQPKVLQEMKIQGDIRKKGEQKNLDKHKIDNFSVAPNSNFDFEIPLGLEKFNPGTYIFTGKAEGDGRIWKWEEEFTIGKEQADKVNDETVYKVVVPSWVPWVAGLLILALVGLIVSLVYRQRQWQERK